MAIQHDVRVRIVCVPMVHSHPVQWGLQVDLHAAHQLAGETLQIFQLQAVLGRDDEAELVAVIQTAFLKGLEVGRIGVSAVGLALLPIAGDAVALDVAKVNSHRVRTGAPQHDEAGLDDHTARVRPQALAGHGGRDAAASEGVGGSAKPLAGGLRSGL